MHTERVLRLSVFASLVLCLLGGLQRVAAQDAVLPAEEKLWYRVEITGQRVGHSFTSVEHVERDGEKLLRYSESGVINLKRLGAAIEIETESVFLERLDGTLVECSTRANMSNRESTTKVVFSGNVATVSTTTAGRTTEKKREVSDDLIGPLAGRQLLVEAMRRGDDELQMTTWSGDLGDALDVTLHIGAREAVTVADGSQRQLVRIRKEMEDMPTEVVGWHDESGLEIVSSTKTSGLEFIAMQTTEADARADEGERAADAPDLFAATMVYERFHLPGARGVGRAVLQVSGRDGGAVPMPIPEFAAQQRLAGDPEGATPLVFELLSRAPHPGHGGRRPLEPGDLPEELRVYLAASSSVQCDAPKLRDRALELVAGQEDAWAAAQLLESWVEQHVQEKGMDVAWASSLEVFEDGAGDCSEHAVLLAAMCRAAGVPCRVAMGSLYIGGAWAGHAWNEVWIDGEWYALDATVGRGRADALRLTLGTMSLDDDAGAREFANLSGNLGGLSIETLELGSGAAARRPAETHGRIEDGAYVDALFGVRIELPRELPLTAKQPGGTISFDLLDTDADSDGAPFRFRLRAYELGADGGAPPFLPIDQGEEIEIDGRPGWSFLRGKERGFAVLANGNAFEFRFRGVDDDEEQRAVDAVMASVDFDYRR